MSATFILIALVLIFSWLNTYTDVFHLHSKEEKEMIDKIRKIPISEWVNGNYGRYQLRPQKKVKCLMTLSKTMGRDANVYFVTHDISLHSVYFSKIYDTLVKGVKVSKSEKKKEKFVQLYKQLGCYEDNK